MDTNSAVFWMMLLFLFEKSKEKSTIACAQRDKYPTPYESSVHAENTVANFSHDLTSVITQTSGVSDFRIQIKLCENGSLPVHSECECRWISGQGPVCKNLINDSMCEADNSTMRFSLLIKSGYKEVLWIFFKQNATPFVMKHTILQVTYSLKITGMYVNGEEINETHLLDENQDVNVSCMFTSGSPPVNVCLVSDTGQRQSMCQKESPLTLSFGVYQCKDMWPTVRCEAPGSDLNRSVAILFKCLRLFSDTATPVLDLTKVLNKGLTFRIKSYTNKNFKCNMALASLHPESLEVTCELSGSVPDFNLTVGFDDKRLLITEGNWTLNITHEERNANISFMLTNNTVEDKSQTPAYVSQVSQTALIVIIGCLLSVAIFISSISFIYIVKLRGRDNDISHHTFTCSPAAIQMTTSGGTNDRLVYLELDFTEKTTSDVVFGSKLETQYANINFAANLT